MMDPNHFMFQFLLVLRQNEWESSWEIMLEDLRIMIMRTIVETGANL